MSAFVSEYLLEFRKAATMFNSVFMTILYHVSCDLADETLNSLYTYLVFII